MKQEWRNIKFDMTLFRDTKCHILKDLDPIFDRLDDDISKVISISSSPYIKFLERYPTLVIKWDCRLEADSDALSRRDRALVQAPKAMAIPGAHLLFGRHHQANAKGGQQIFGRRQNVEATDAADGTSARSLGILLPVPTQRNFRTVNWNAGLSHKVLNYHSKEDLTIISTWKG